MKEISFRDDILPLKDKLFRVALRITFDRAEAEDIVQETLIKVWNKREEWNSLESIEAYCLTLTKNLAIDLREKMDARTENRCLPIFFVRIAILHSNLVLGFPRLRYSHESILYSHVH